MKRGTLRTPLWAAGLLALATCGARCSEGAVSELPGRQGPPAGPEAVADVVSEPSPSETAQTLREVGEDCSAVGGEGCVSGVCLHADVDSRTGGFVCSRECGGTSDCPAGWRCLQTHPGPDSELCIPPETVAEAQRRP